MKKKYSFATRCLSLLLCAVMIFGQIPPIQVKAATVSKVYSTSELAYGGVNMVPSSLRYDDAFMSAYVYNGNRLNINSSFKKVGSSNNKSGDTLPTGTIQGKSSGKWWVTYKWTPTEAEKKAFENGGLYFESNMTSDYHSHWVPFGPDKAHWSTSGIRLSLPNEDGSNSWQYGVSDYGRDPNGEWIFTDGSREKNDGQPQPVSDYWGSMPFSDSLFFNAYQLWDRTCGNAKVSGTVFYFAQGGGPSVSSIKLSAAPYQVLENGKQHTVTLNFDTQIRFADNKAHDDLKLVLDAEYLPQSGETGDFQIVADFTGMTETSMTFTYTLDASEKHFKITGIADDQSEYIEKETELLVWDASGQPLNAVKLTAETVLSDMYGSDMSRLNLKDFNDVVYDGVAPRMTKLEMIGSGVTNNAEMPDSWNANSGSKADVFAGPGESFSFRLQFSEDISVSGRDKLRAVLSVTDGSETIKLPVASVGKDYITFQSVTVTEAMREAGARIRITGFENVQITDKAGNPLDANTMTGNNIIPAQEVYLDVDAPYITTTATAGSDGVYTPSVDTVGERFSFPVKFQETANGSAENSGISGKDAFFRLEMLDGAQYSYKWYVDNTQAISSSPRWRAGTTGKDNVIRDIADGAEYWVHVELDKNLNYNYDAAGGLDENGIYFNGKLTFGGLSDWADNVAADVSYTLKHQVDKVKPTTSITSGISMTPNYAAYSATFEIPISAADNYSLEKLFYQWEIAVGSGSFTPVGDGFTEVSVGEILKRETTVDVAPYTYTFDGTIPEQRYGRVRLKAYSEDQVGYTSDVVTSKEVSFNFQKAVSNSHVVLNDAANATKLPVTSIVAPSLEGGSANPPVTMLVIPDENSGDGTGFWIWKPSWDSDSGSYEYGDDPISEYVYYHDESFLMYAPGYFLRAEGTIDVDRATGTFTSLTRLNATLYGEETEEEIAALKAAQEELYNYLTQYYGSMELYTVTTTSIGTGISSLDFTEADSSMDTYEVYLANGTQYSFSDITILNAKGQTDAQVGAGEPKLNYVSGEGRPGAVNLDNVSVSVKINNTKDASSRNGVSYGLEYLDYSAGNAAFELFKTSSAYADYEQMNNWYDPIKTWDLVKSDDGVNTIVFEPGLCVENGWYTLALTIEDTVNGTQKTEILGNFFVDATTLDISLDSVYKELYVDNENTADHFEWQLSDVEEKYAAGEDIWIGMGELPESWDYYTIFEDQNDYNYIRFVNTGRPDGINDDGADSDDLAAVRVYNQTYNAQASLDKDAGLWISVSDTDSSTHTYEPHLADPANSTDAYGSAEWPKLPFVEGSNLLVYEVKSSNGIVTTKTMVLYVDTGSDDQWDLNYSLEYSEVSGVASCATIWPVLADGSAMTLNDTDTYDQTMYNFRELDHYSSKYAQEYKYYRLVDNVGFYIIDPLGNISEKRISIKDSEGNLLVIDRDAPYSIGNSLGVSRDETLDMDYYHRGDTFFFSIYAYDQMSDVSMTDMELIFDEEYSKVLPGGSRDEEGRAVVKVPLALDENGEPLKNADGTYAIWESMDPSYNGIYRTQLVDYGYQDEWNRGYVSIRIWGAWKYDASLSDNIRYFYYGATDTNGYRDVEGGLSNVYYTTNCTTPYTLTVGALNDGTISQGVLNEDGTIGIYTTVPFQSLTGHGVGKMQEAAMLAELGFYGELKDPVEGRYFYYPVPMITQDGTYEFIAKDLFGAEHTISVEVTQFGQLGVDVSFSTTEPTNQSVTVYANSTGNIENLVSIVADDGTEGFIDPNDPTSGSITVDENCTITITTDAEPASVRKVRVSNIDKTLEPARIRYFDQNYRTLNTALGATEVTAVLDCDEPVFTTNGVEEYTFPAGTAAGATYTFEYRDIAGNTGTITATLPINLEVVVPDVDDEEADVEIGLYSYRKGLYDLIARGMNPGTDETAGESEITANLNAEENKGYKAQMFKVVLSIRDESDYKILVTPTDGTAPTDYASVETGSTVENVTLTTGRDTATLEIAENASFNIYVIDALNNVASYENLRINNIDKIAPVLTPNYSLSKDEDGYAVVVATFLPTEEEKLEELTPLSTDILSTKVLDENGNEMIRYYHIFPENGTYTFNYEDMAGNRGDSSAEVRGLSTDPARVNSISWFGTKTEDGRHNVSPDMSAPVNKDVTAQLRMSKPISKVELFRYDEKMMEGFGEQLDENSPVKVSFTASTIDITYTENVDYQIIVRFTASASGRRGTYILPAVICMDREAPVVTLAGTEVAQDKQSMKFMFTTDETAILSQNATKGYNTNHQWIAKEDKPVTLYFSDKAGNQISYPVTDFPGMDTKLLDVIYSASADGSNATEDPVNGMHLSAGATFYIKVNKRATGTIGNGNQFVVEANVWTPVQLPSRNGLHILTLKDNSTGSSIQELVCALPKDNVPPTIELASGTVLVYQNATEEEVQQAIHTGVTVTDDVDQAPTYTVTGVPASAAEGGLHTLYYTARDASGNEAFVERVLYIMDENAPILWINDDVGLPYNKVFIDADEVTLRMDNIAEDQPAIIKVRKGIYTTGQMKYYATIVENMTVPVEESGHYTIYVRTQDRAEFITYVYVEG